MKYKMNIHSKFLSQSGSSLVEVLMATVLIAISALVMAGMLKNFIVLGSNKDRAIELAMEYESLIISASQDLEANRDAAPELFLGNSDVNFEVKNSSDVVVAKNNQVLGFFENGNSCDPTSQICRLTSEVRIRCFGQIGASYDCRLGYKVLVNDQKGIPVRAFGVRSEQIDQAGFEDENFGLMLAYDAFSQNNTDLTNECEEMSSKILTGYNKETGQVYCASLPETACAANQFPIGLNYDSAAHRFLMVCGRSWQAFCPENYAIKDVDMKGALTGSGDITCVFVGKKSVPWRNSPASAQSINKRFCPEHYVTQASCSPVNGSITYSPGTCDVYGTCLGAINPVTGIRAPSYSCVVGQRVGAQPSAPTIVKTDGSLNASCYQSPGVGECGGTSYFGSLGVRSDVSMSGTCVLAKPETVPGWWQ